MVVGDGADGVELDDAALLEQLLELASGALDPGLHSRHRDAQRVGGAMVGLAGDVDSLERVTAGRGELVEEWLEAARQLAGGIVRLAVGCVGVGPVVVVVE